MQRSSSPLKRFLVSFSLYTLIIIVRSSSIEIIIGKQNDKRLQLSVSLFYETLLYRSKSRISRRSSLEIERKLLNKGVYSWSKIISFNFPPCNGGTSSHSFISYSRNGIYFDPQKKSSKVARCLPDRTGKDRTDKPAGGK